MATARVTRFIRLRHRAGPRAGEWAVPAELRPRLAADAEAQGSNMNEVAVRILADRYRVEVEPNENAKRSNASEDGWQLNLRLPVELDRTIEATKPYPLTRKQAIVAALCAHYGIEYEPLASAAAA